MSAGSEIESRARFPEPDIQSLEKNVGLLREYFGSDFHAFCRILLDDVQALRNVPSQVAGMADRINKIEREILQLEKMGPQQYVGPQVKASALVNVPKNKPIEAPSVKQTAHQELIPARPPEEENIPERERLELEEAMKESVKEFEEQQKEEKEDRKNLEKGIAKSIKRSPTHEADTLAIQKGLSEIEQSYTVRSIKPDGHCAFRAYATGLLAGTFPKEKLESNLNELEKTGEYKGIDFNLLRESVKEARDNPAGLDALLNRMDVSNEWVKFCRRILAVETNKQPANKIAQELRGDQSPRFPVADLTDKEIQWLYLDYIQSMDTKITLWGGPTEFKLLDGVFGAKHVAMNAKAIGSFIEGKQAEGVPQHSEERNTIYLVEAPDQHFVSAFPYSKMEEID